MAACVCAAILFGFVLLAIKDLLSVISEISQAGLFSAWLIVSAGLAIYGFRRKLLQIGLQKMWQHLRSLQPRQPLLLSPFLVIFLMLFIVGVILPANNVDSLLYHMARAVHWAQNQNLSYFATTNYKQLINPIWPEFAMLNHRVLVVSDLRVNLVQWFSMFASVIGVTAIAALLGLNRWGIWLTAAFAISFPMGILQSTTTQTDYVAAFWTVCLMYTWLSSGNGGSYRDLSLLASGSHSAWVWYPRAPSLPTPHVSLYDISCRA